MKQALALLLLLILTVAVQGLEFQDERSRRPWYKKKPAPKPGSPPSSKKKPEKPPAPVLSRDGLVAPLTRMNIQDASVPSFVVELRVGSPPVAVNFTIDTMGTHTAMPWQLCSNVTTAATFTTTDSKGNENWKKTPPSSPPPPERSSSPPGRPLPWSPVPPSSSSPPEKPSTPPGRSWAPPGKPWQPPSSSSPPGRPGKQPWQPPSSSTPPSLPPTYSGAIQSVPCSHPVCQGSSYTCDKVRKRCMAYDRYTGKPIDLVLSQLTMESVYPSGDVASQNRTIAGIVMGCSAPSSVPYASTSMASLSPGATSLVSQIATAASLPRRFAYCLGKPRGAFFVGGADYVFRQRSVKPKMQYLPMLTPPAAWQRGMGYRLALRGIAVGSGPDVKPLPIDSSLFDNGVVIGTKLRYTSLVDPAYQVVRRHFMAVAAASNASITPVPSPFPELNLCYRIPPRAAVSGAPKIQFIFENATLTVQPRNYIVRWRRTDVVCLGIVGAGALGRVSVIGTLQQEETLVEFDLEKRVVGVSEHLSLSGNSCKNFEFLPDAPWPRRSPITPAPSPGAPVLSEDDEGSFDEEEEVGIAPSSSS
ncbi:uncharacterized protein LOC112340596 [Selaginella moellendorffii]|uniref:uncharacterized protein LOC112340596 n=1 Tax=Selaginella moellendorffii TaxID=88036 RepID=UPI000D1CB076|nr:uncharacterized protein LOC112340596 [Selaginella moellendorffii]|eukprot:XP_024515075.1 uncharacterized protein LOC112340596 [Selaginella moellendorffii]